MVTPLTTARWDPYVDERTSRDDREVLRDLRFRALLGQAAWSRLPAAVRERFSKRLIAGTAVTYVGEIIESRGTLLGSLIRQLARLIGAPLPLHDDIGAPRRGHGD